MVPGSSSSLLDWDNAQFTLPIDQYAMSQRDIQLVNAAHTVLLIRCVTGQDQLNDVQMNNVRKWLSLVDLSQHWMFGNWDAPYIAQHGGQMTGLASIDTGSVEDLALDLDKMVACVNEDPTVLNMTPRSPMFGYTSGSSDDLSDLWGYWFKGVSQAHSDHRFKALIGQRNKCTQSKGYSIYYPDNDGIGALSYDEKWTDDQRRQAELAEAQCSDDMNFTQQVIEMIATNQMLIIQQHQAKLEAIKQILDQRVADATKLLTDLGLL